MGRNTARILSLAERMAAAGVDPLYVNEVKGLTASYAAQRGTMSKLHADNMELRKLIAKLAPETVVKDAEQ